MSSRKEAMYLNYHEVSAKLRCSFCDHQITNVVKLIPQCGNSICEDCYEALLSDMDEENGEFACKPCNFKLHLLPAEGLPDNHMAMKIINMEPIEKALNEKTKTLKSSIEDTQLKIDKLKSYDKEQAINTYCDLLESEVMLTFESAFKHLNKLQDELLVQIKDYRHDLLEASTLSDSTTDTAATSTAASSKIKQDLDSWTIVFNYFARQWSEYFVQINLSVEDEKIDEAQSWADFCQRGLSKLDKDLRDLTFGNKFMVFKENPGFILSNDHLGELEVWALSPGDPGSGSSESSSSETDKSSEQPINRVQGFVSNSPLLKQEKTTSANLAGRSVNFTDMGDELLDLLDSM